MQDRPRSVMPNILVLNTGSSSLKFAVFDVAMMSCRASGSAQRLGSAEASFDMKTPSATISRKFPGATVLQAMAKLFEEVSGTFFFAAIGHRVVHGGEFFTEGSRIDDASLGEIERCGRLAPLHNPQSTAVIRAARRHFPNTPQVAVFDTAFHQTLPSRAFHYAIPYEFYEKHGIRRYGFHGTSHGYVGEQAADRLGLAFSDLNAITVHLGNGCSACAIRRGKSVDTTMGLTPLEGLVMGNRSGDVDPALHAFLADCENLTLRDIDEILNNKSGLLGLSGLSNDMRTLAVAEEEGSERARLAIDVFCHRLAKAILSMGASLETVDALVFTGGIGENSATVRERTLAQLSVLGVRCDRGLNSTNGCDTQGRITTGDSVLPAFVIETNEELAIARETLKTLARAPCNAV